MRWPSSTPTARAPPPCPARGGACRLSTICWRWPAGPTSAAPPTPPSARRPSPPPRWQALEGRRACLLANHGALALGSTLAAAEALAREVENLSGQFLALLGAGLPPVLLTPTEMAEVEAQFAGYGRL
jgi:hypothetical protein